MPPAASRASSTAPISCTASCRRSECLPPAPLRPPAPLLRQVGPVERHHRRLGRVGRVLVQHRASSALAVLRHTPTLGSGERPRNVRGPDRKSTRLNSSHGYISYSLF